MSPAAARAAGQGARLGSCHVDLGDGGRNLARHRCDVGPSSLNTTSVGTVDVSLLALFFDAALGLVVVPEVNALLAGGFPLPSAPGLELKNASLANGQGFLAFASNFTLDLGANAAAALGCA